jgi:hypothetical protein
MFAHFFVFDENDDSESLRGGADVEGEMRVLTSNTGRSESASYTTATDAEEESVTLSM